MIGLINATCIPVNVDISNARYAGKSHGHSTEAPATKVYNGSGARNVQTFFLTNDGKVLHCLPGYWDADSLKHEISFAMELNKIYKNKMLKPEKKDQLFKKYHEAHFDTHSRITTINSKLQNFDMKYVMKNNISDFIKQNPDEKEMHEKPYNFHYDQYFKTVDEVMHTRMAERPFKSFPEFDTANYVNIGTRFYDSNKDGCRDCAEDQKMLGKTAEKKEVQKRLNRSSEKRNTSAVFTGKKKSKI
ncbi:MAG: hypothetical protein HY606_11545 [Planctomycetes bacterium]|nr:hypothetical protein [Planctomycetota bacterium]